MSFIGCTEENIAVDETMIGSLLSKWFIHVLAIYHNNIYMKMSSATIAPLLTYIFNCSVKQQIFPKAFKLAKITPIYKKGEKSNKKQV